MEEIVSFAYNLFLVIAYTSVIATAACLNLIRKRDIAIPVIGLFSFYLIDTLIIYMTETIPLFLAWYDQTYLASPSIKTVIYLGIGFFTLYAWSVLIRSRFTPLQTILLILLGLWLAFIPLMESGALKSWIYFLGYQVFNIGICIYALWKLKHLDRLDYDGPFGWIRVLLVFTIVFSVLIVLEDSFVIFRLDNYASNALFVYSRNISEDMLRLIYTVFFFRLFYKQLRLSGVNAPDPVVCPASASAPREAEYKQMKFVRAAGLTEREAEVFLLMLRGQSNQDIGQALHISMGTVKAHVHNIFQKAQVTHRYELLRQYDMFSPDETEA